MTVLSPVVDPSVRVVDGPEDQGEDGGRRPVAVILGTRAEAIRLAPVVRALRRSPQVLPLVVSTGQDGELLDQALRPLGVRPDVDLTPVAADQPLHRVTAQVIERLGEWLAATRPAAVVVEGDSTTAFGGALAAFCEGIPIAHVGAGLRSGVLDDPFPEEANRRLIARLATWHLPATAASSANLIAEGVDPRTITITGSTGVDSLRWASDLRQGASAFVAGSGTGPRVLVALRRADGDPRVLERTARMMGRLAADGADVVAVHPDPPALVVLTAALVAACGCPDVGRGPASLISVGPRVQTANALPYPDFVATVAAATLVVTDSAGVAEEASALAVPVLMARDLTERSDGDVVLAASPTEVAHPGPGPEPRPALGPDDDGRAADRVVEALARALLPH